MILLYYSVWGYGKERTEMEELSKDKEKVVAEKLKKDKRWKGKKLKRHWKEWEEGSKELDKDTEVDGCKSRSKVSVSGKRREGRSEMGNFQVPHQTTVQKVTPQLFHHGFVVC